MSMPNMEIRFKRSRPFGHDRFRGLVKWVSAKGVTTRVLCEDTCANKELALEDATRLLNVLRKRDWTKEGTT